MDRKLAYLALALLLAGCATAPVNQPETPAATTTQIESPALIGETPPSVEPEPKPPASNNRAVLALLDRAQSDNASGKHAAAGASLERALRIEPRNAWLWNELAQVRLAQGQYAQAASLAKKSISFSGNDRRLQSANWRVIGDARTALGDSAGAEQAFRTADELQQVPSVPGL